MLLYFGVKPYLIFDGDDLPSKAGTECDRHKRRQDSKALGLELQRKGRMAEAYQEFQKAVDVTPYMARQLIEHLKKMDVQYVVAPYEADAQMVYLERQGIIDGIISEDSDLLVFGAKRLLSKLDHHGDLIEINRADFTACREVSLIGWTDADFRRMCILSGCDYLPNITKLGLKTAYRCIRKYKNVEKALRMLQFDGQYRVPADYLQNFKQAEFTFLYQRVFCPTAGKLVTLTTPEADVNIEEMPYIGQDVEPDAAVGVARGDLDPTTKEPIILKPLPISKMPCGLQRRQTLGSSAELKPNKPISTFFTPKRTPLAELDPNSLTPSPSQQRLLERYANSSWEASPAPSQPTPIRSASSAGHPSRVSSPLVRSAERNSFLARAAKTSTFQPAKRQRLCSEAGEESLPTRTNCRSRFFVHMEEDSSPSGQKGPKTEKPRKSKLDIFSDESAEDIMSQIPDPGEGAKLEANGAQTPCKTSKDQEIPHARSPSPNAASKQVDEESQKRESDEGATSDAVPDKSVSVGSDSKAFHQVLGYHVQRQNTSLLSRFTFQPKESPTASEEPPVNGGNVQSHSSNGCNSQASPAGLLLGARPSPSRRQRLTPLQRLGQNALSRSRSMYLPNTKKPPFLSGVSGRSRTDISTGPHIDTPNPAGSQGSEDMIVPNSEDESEDDNSNDSKPGQGPIALDLKQFSFAPNRV